MAYAGGAGTSACGINPTWGCTNYSVPTDYWPYPFSPQPSNITIPPDLDALKEIVKEAVRDVLEEKRNDNG